MRHLETITQICSPRIAKEALSGIENSELGEIAKEAASHGVAGWMTYRLKKDYADDKTSIALQGELKRYVLAVFIQNQKNIKICESLRAILDAEGIEMGLLKGAALMTSCYEETWMRPIGDIDVWIRHDDVYRAYELLKERGLKAEQNFRTNVIYESVRTHLSPLAMNGQSIEIHYNLYSRDSLRNPNESIERHMVDGRGFKVLDDEMMLYHLTTHIIKNHEHQGLRLGWIVDIIMLFDKWGERSDEIRKAALKYNPSLAKEMERVWDAIDDLTPESLDGLGKGNKHGWKVHLRSGLYLASAIIKSIAEKPSLQRIKDIAHDLENRNKNQAKK